MLVHICNNYVSSKVHAQLVSSISRSPGSIEQKVYVPVRNKNHVGMNDVSGSDVSVKYVQCLNGWIRFFPLLKVLWVFLVAVVNKVIAERKEGFVLAHTLWSDGVVAYLYRVFWGVEYALVVRNTDLNWFYLAFRIIDGLSVKLLEIQMLLFLLVLRIATALRGNILAYTALPLKLELFRMAWTNFGLIMFRMLKLKETLSFHLWVGLIRIRISVICVPRSS